MSLFLVWARSTPAIKVKRVKVKLNLKLKWVKAKAKWAGLQFDEISFCLNPLILNSITFQKNFVLIIRHCISVYL